MSASPALQPRELPGGLVVAFREGTPEDEPLIYGTWLNGFHDNGDWPRRVPGGRYFHDQKHVIKALLEQAKVTVACNPARGWQVLGYIVHEPGVLHWVYVKPAFRWDPGAAEHPRLGSVLRDEAFPHLKAWVSCSHWTRTADKLSDRWGLRYRPFLLEVP